MPLPNSEHLFEQAERLTAVAAGGAPRQVDLRRAISSAYYGVFHAALTAAADMFVGKTRRTSVQYALVYRSVDHRWLRDLCWEVRKPSLSAKYGRYAPAKGFGVNIQGFADAVLYLQEKRHAADYDPLIRIKSSDALVAVGTARTALDRFRRANATRRRAFLALLLFRPH